MKSILCTFGLIGIGLSFQVKGPDIIRPPIASPFTPKGINPNRP